MKARFNALKKNAYGRIAVLFVVCLFPFSLARALLFGIYHSDFAQLGAFDVVLAFIVGLRFDASITAMALGLPLVMILLPFKFAHRGAWQTVWGWVGYAMLVLLIFMLAADLFYFEVVRRHAGPEVSALAADIPSMIYLAVDDFPWGLTV
ncbi:MAG: hypothetical protein OEW08_15430, partial [Gammaproteobacteria bacterium]|nr:hypothetical protein [Gammaproteobacteria bacterium]